MLNRFTLLPFMLAAGGVLSARVTITPEKPSVLLSGGALQFKANVPVKWSLAPGSAGSIDSNGTYRAPASISVKNVLAGCQILGNDHIFNTRIDSLPVHPNSPAWMAVIPSSGLGYFPGWGTTLANRNTPKKPMHFAYTPGNDGLFEMVAWPDLKRESGIFSDTHSNVDRHVVTVDQDSCDIFELYNDYNPGQNTACSSCNAQSGFHYRGIDPGLPSGSVDAAGMLLAPLTARLDEIRSGLIQHALRVTMKNNIIARQYVWPARTNAGAYGKIPYGTRFRLKAGYDTSKFNKYAQVLLTQLKEYGLILADGGSNWDVNVSTDITEDPAVESSLQDVHKYGPRSADFEIVDESPLMASPASGSIKAAANPNLKPEGYAIVIATSESNPAESAHVQITLQGVTVGVPDPADWIQSGVTVHMKSWVHGTADKQVRWSMEPQIGSLSPEGEFTPPEVEKPAYTLMTVASAADPKAHATVGVTVLPKGGIRIKIGNATAAPGAPNRFAPDYGPDSEGNMWLREQAGEVTWGVANDDWYGEPWPKAKDIQLYYTSRYSLGDMVYRFMVPNGRYKITILFAQPQCKTVFPKEWRIPFHLETQGKLVIPNFDMGAGIGYACLTPVQQSIPAVVTDNTLYLALRRVTIKDYMPSPLLNGFAITPDDSAPHLAIAPAKVSSLTIDQQIPFKAVGWYMGEKATWSVAKGPGTITPDGVYTAPSAPPAGEQTVEVQARSVLDPSKTATAAMVFKFGNLALTPATATVLRSLNQQFTATIDGAKYSNLAWSVEPQIGTISQDGLYTAPESLARNTPVTIKAQSKDVSSKIATVAILLKASPDPIRINCGGFGFKDTQGNAWSADANFSKPSLAYNDKVPIAGSTDDMLPLYQSSRYAYSDQNFNYTFALPNGKYAVTLKFADYTYKEPGHYNFDVLLNGSKVLSNFDPDTVNGPRAAADKKFQVTVSGKSLRIDFIGHKGGALINGIEILSLGG